MINAQGFAKLLDHMKPTFIEVKGVVHVGYSQLRMERKAMPYHEEIMDFSRDLQKHLENNYNIVADKANSKDN